jgi:cell wall-associated NlpC family hydrolase
LAQAKAKQDAEQAVVNRLTAEQAARLTAEQAAQVVANDTTASDRAKAALAYALAQVGKAYVMGGVGPDSFDCSGLVLMAYRQIGISLPHNARIQADFGTPVDRGNLAPGDLLFFYTPIGHVAMYIGNGLIVHASTPATGVKISGVMWGNFVAARRLA